LGKEVSSFYLCDGQNAVPLGSACDHKQLLDGGLGPNTGGMGAYSPVDWLESGFAGFVQQTIVEPLLNRMNLERTPFRGVLFIGLMLTEEGPKVLEFNVRFGDPETQALLPLLEEDIFPWLQACVKGKLGVMPSAGPKFRAGSAVHVVMAASGYPGTVKKGDGIEIDSGLFSLPEAEGKLFFAGVAGEKNQFHTNGGRVLGLTAFGDSRALAKERAYRLLNGIQFEGAQHRGDIGG
jgi:phosphoribosylamine--glycine ligase